MAQWVEYQLKNLARQHPAYLKDTKHLLKFIEDLNDQQGPFQKEQVIMISMDIENFYPSCETNKCIEAIELLLNQRTIKCPSTECIFEALSITMSSNSAHFSNRYFIQINGATIGSPDSGSVTDIYGAIHIDKKLMEESPIKPQNYKRYRDDTLDICINSSDEEQKELTNWMNDNICKDRIKFKIEEMGPDVKFLDTRLRMIKDERYVDEDKYIIAPSMYSKDTDTHQYLSPKSCHPVHITKNIPTTVAYRCRANCSDKIKNDVMFKEALIEYNAYLIKSGHDEKNADKSS